MSEENLSLMTAQGDRKATLDKDINLGVIAALLWSIDKSMKEIAEKLGR